MPGSHQPAAQSSAGQVHPAQLGDEALHDGGLQVLPRPGCQARQARQDVDLAAQPGQGHPHRCHQPRLAVSTGTADQHTPHRIPGRLRNPGAQQQAPQHPEPDRPIRKAFPLIGAQLGATQDQRTGLGGGQREHPLDHAQSRAGIVRPRTCSHPVSPHWATAVHPLDGDTCTATSRRTRLSHPAHTLRFTDRSPRPSRPANLQARAVTRRAPRPPAYRGPGGGMTSGLTHTAGQARFPGV
jgi:hypothetical protein